MKKVKLIQWAVIDKDGTDISIHLTKEYAQWELQRCKTNYEGKFRVIKVKIEELLK